MSSKRPHDSHNFMSQRTGAVSKDLTQWRKRQESQDDSAYHEEVLLSSHWQKTTRKGKSQAGQLPFNITSQIPSGKHCPSKGMFNKPDRRNKPQTATGKRTKAIPIPHPLSGLSNQQLNDMYRTGNKYKQQMNIIDLVASTRSKQPISSQVNEGIVASQRVMSPPERFDHIESPGSPTINNYMGSNQQEWLKHKL